MTEHKNEYNSYVGIELFDKGRKYGRQETLQKVEKILEEWGKESYLYDAHKSIFQIKLKLQKLKGDKL